MTVVTTSAADGSWRTLVTRRGGVAELGRWAAHYALVVVFLWFGLLKFSAFEASGIAPLVSNNLFMSWTYAVLGVAGGAKLIGVVEILAGLLLAARPFAPRAAVAGAGLAVLTFLITLSFMLTTPGVLQPGADSFLDLSPMPGQFLLKDLVLLCFSVWILGASLDEAAARR